MYFGTAHLPALRKPKTPLQATPGGGELKNFAGSGNLSTFAFAPVGIRHFLWKLLNQT